MTLLIPAENLSEGDVMLLPMQRTATILNEPKVGRKFVSFKTEHGPTRIELGVEVHVEARVA